MEKEIKKYNNPDISKINAHKQLLFLLYKKGISLQRKKYFIVEKKKKSVIFSGYISFLEIKEIA